MNTITSFDVNQKINELPISLLAEVDKYIDFLKFKNLDLNENFSEVQINLIQKGKLNIEQ